MAAGKLRFTEHEVTRLVRAAHKGGMKVARVEVDRDGKISVIAGSENGGVDDAPKVFSEDQWDDALK